MALCQSLHARVIAKDLRKIDGFIGYCNKAAKVSALSD